MAAPVYRVGFIGLGVMGYRMAGRLCEAAAVSACHELLHASRSANFPSPRDVVRDVLCRQMKPYLRDGGVVVDCTSGDPREGVKIAAEMAEMGITVLDAPVSGGPSGADAGTLTTMVGGPSIIVEQVRPIMEAYASTIVHAGEKHGAGFALKAINNILNASHLLIAAEGLISLNRWGVKPSVALQAINGSSGRSMATQIRIPEQVLTRKFAHGFEMALMNKDVQIGASIIREYCPDFEILPAAAQLFERATEDIGGDEDYTKAVCYLEKIAKCELRE